MQFGTFLTPPKTSSEQQSPLFDRQKGGRGANRGQPNYRFRGPSIPVICIADYPWHEIAYQILLICQ